jgi:hypothetical protein
MSLRPWRRKNTSTPCGHSHITLLGRNGVSPKTAQELARHSDYKLTMKVYTHVGLYHLAGAVNGCLASFRQRRRPMLFGLPEQTAESLAQCGFLRFVREL